MRILVIGSGGREHALCYALKKSSDCSALYCAPGNAGISEIAECVALTVSDHAKVAAWCHENQIGLVVVGPEGPLVAGLADDLEKAGLKVFGPSKITAQLEGSKGYVKDLCKEFDIPTAAYGRFTEAKSAKEFLEKQTMPIVIKADGLAAGKGVIIAQTYAEAAQTVDEMLSGKFGEASKSIVIEEFLEGEEVSFFALCDGRHAIPFGAAQDHKRVGDGDTGPNTGGMGTYMPAPIWNDTLQDRVMKEIIEPTVKAMQSRGAPYRGVFFAGLMITKQGPKLIEYNIRFGDPETQVLMLSLESDLAELMLACVDGTIANKKVIMSQETALCVVMAAKGYPGDYEKNTVIKNLDAAKKLATIFHAGTAYKNGDLVATGGRVLNICARGKSVAEAQKKAYQAIDVINWSEGFCRRDIGWRALEHERKRA